MQQSIRFLPTFPERPTNPARVNVRTGDIEINSARWAELSGAEREFVLQHEIGHYKRKTFDEISADEYALSKLALKKPYSLINYLNAVDKISYSNPERVSAAQFNTLQIAAANGSEEAKKLLSRYNASADGDNRSSDWWWIVLLILGLLFIYKIM